MIKDLEELEKLELNIPKELQVDLNLQSFTSLCSQFIINFYMNKLDYTISKLVNILVTIEKILKSSRGNILTME